MAAEWRGVVLGLAPKHAEPSPGSREREFLIDNLLVRIRFIIEMFRVRGSGVERSGAGTRAQARRALARCYRGTSLKTPPPPPGLP